MPVPTGKKLTPAKPAQSVKPAAKPAAKPTAKAKPNGADHSPFSRTVSAANRVTPPPADPIRAIGVIESAEVSTTKNPNRLQLAITMAYPSDDPENKFTDSIFYDPAWFELTQEEVDAMKAAAVEAGKGTDEAREYNSYNMSYQGKIVKLQDAAWGEGFEDKVFPDDLVGCEVNFTANPRSDDKTRLQFGTFYAVKQQTQSDND